MSKNQKNQNEQIPAAEVNAEEVQAAQVISDATQEADAATEASVPEAQEPKAERIYKLLMKLVEAKKIKDDRAGKKIRRQLRKLGYYISKQPKPDTI